MARPRKAFESFMPHPKDENDLPGTEEYTRHTGLHANGLPHLNVGQVHVLPSTDVHYVKLLAISLQ